VHGMRRVSARRLVRNARVGNGLVVRPDDHAAYGGISLGSRVLRRGQNVERRQVNQQENRRTKNVRFIFTVSCYKRGVPPRVCESALGAMHLVRMSSLRRTSLDRDS
jgi:hypothetical protein